MILKAKYDYRSGNILLLPRTGFAPGLFLEYLENEIFNNKISSKIKVQKSFIDADSDYFIIKMENEIKETFLNAVEYINNNLPKD